MVERRQGEDTFGTGKCGKHLLPEKSGEENVNTFLNPEINITERATKKCGFLFSVFFYIKIKDDTGSSSKI